VRLQRKKKLLMTENQFDLEISMEQQISVDSVLRSETPQKFRSKLRELQCKRCARECALNNNVVPGGNSNSKIMLAYPTANNTINQKTNNLLSKHGFSASNIYLTSCEKSNTFSLPTFRKCKIFFLREVELVRPELVIFVGHKPLIELFDFGSKTLEKHVAGRFFGIRKSPFSSSELFVLSDPAGLSILSGNEKIILENRLEEELRKIAKKID
jgi:uracil-DNA glycosylase